MQLRYAVPLGNASNRSFLGKVGVNMFLAPIGSATIKCARDIMLLRNLINPRLLNAIFLFNLGNGVEVGDGDFFFWLVLFTHSDIVKHLIYV